MDISVRRRVGAAGGALAVGAALVLGAVGPAMAQDTAAVCTKAQKLVDDALPQQAVALIAATRGTSTTSTTTTTPPSPGTPSTTTTTTTTGDDACTPELTLAVQAVAAAKEHAAQARSASDASPADWGAVLDAADAALALDAENAEATDLKAAAERARHTGVQSLGASWSDAVDQYGTPLVRPALAVLVVVALLLALARASAGASVRWPRIAGWPRGALVAGAVLALVDAAVVLTWAQGLSAAGTGTWPFWAMAASAVLAAGLGGWVTLALPRVRETAPRPWLGIAIAAEAAVLAAATLLVLVAVGAGPGTGPQTGRLVLAGAGLAAAGVLLGATWTATRLRLSVEVHDGDDAADGNGRVVAYVRELGAEPPRGLELARGADVEALSGQVLAILPDNAVLQAAVKLVRGVFGSIPWRVVIEGDAEHLTVAITRNGRTAGSAVVDRAELLQVVGEDAQDADTRAAIAAVDLRKAAAAVVMTTLARHHDRFEGLCGTTSWRALALHYVATVDLRGRDDVQRALLARALDLDPGSWLAQLAYRAALERRSTDRAVVAAYRRWLRVTLDGDGESAYGGTAGSATPVLGPDTTMRTLRLRALYSRACLAINEEFADTESVPVFTLLTVADVAAVIDALNAEPRDPEPGTVPRAAVSAGGSPESVVSQMRTAIEPARALLAETAAAAVDRVGQAARLLADLSGRLSGATPPVATDTEAMRAVKRAAQATGRVGTAAERAARAQEALVGAARPRPIDAPDRTGAESPQRRAALARVRLEGALLDAQEAVAVLLAVTAWPPGAEDVAREPLARLTALLGGPAPDLAAAATAAAVALPVLLLNRPTSLGPTAHYNKACYHATKPVPDYVNATEHLRVAAGLPELRAWSVEDHQLAAYRRSKEYIALFGRRRRTDLFALPEFAPHAAALRTLGVVDGAGLVAASSSAVVRACGLRFEQVAFLCRVSQVHVSASQPGRARVLRDFAVEVTADLVDRGTADVAALAALPDADAGTLAAAVVESVTGRVDTTIGADGLRDAIVAWLASLAGSTTGVVPAPRRAERGAGVELDGVPGAPVVP